MKWWQVLTSWQLSRRIILMLRHEDPSPGILLTPLAIRSGGRVGAVRFSFASAAKNKWEVGEKWATSWWVGENMSLQLTLTYSLHILDHKRQILVSVTCVLVFSLRANRTVLVKLLLLNGGFLAWIFLDLILGDPVKLLQSHNQELLCSASVFKSSFHFRVCNAEGFFGAVRMFQWNPGTRFPPGIWKLHSTCEHAATRSAYLFNLSLNEEEAREKRSWLGNIC